MRSHCILLVEDDVWMGALLAEMLGLMGHTICGIETTEAGAVDAALRDEPDLMIVDANLGKGSGIAAVQAICRRIDIPHIFMSGERIASGRTPAIVLQKPFTLPTLQQAIDRTMGT